MDATGHLEGRRGPELWADTRSQTWPDPMADRWPDRWPDWLPENARNYLAHVAEGRPIRALAREGKVHASTILRQVRRVEAWRDDPLVDDALRDLSHRQGAQSAARKRRAMTGEAAEMAAGRDETMAGGGPGSVTEARIAQEGLRILRRLAETGTVLAVARDMEMAVVVRDTPEGGTQRLAVVEREIAQALALKDWITCQDPAARVVRYHLTATGRQEVRRLLAERREGAGFAEASARFDGARPEGDRNLRHMRSLLGDSPVTALARRQDKQGQPFLTRDLVAAAERLREDFELSHSGPQVARNWDSFLTAGVSGGAPPADGLSRGGLQARDRLLAALADLGPGLADVALRCCCFLEGLETIEARMGWSARSGKIVLRIALQRLKRHYAATQGGLAPPIA